VAASAPGRGCPYGVIKKFGDDNANLLVVSLAWYGFTAIFPLLLVVVTVLGGCPGSRGS
jgi:membrane protein